MSDASPSGSEARSIRTVTASSALELAAGEHLCAFYRGHAGLSALVLPFLRDGLRRRERCAVVMDTPPPSWVFSLFAGEDPRLRNRLAERLDVVSSWESCRTGGGFSAGRMSAWLADCGADRVAAEMTWALRVVKDAADITAYESELGQVLVASPVAILCLYDLDSLDGGEVVEIVDTHRRVLVEGSLVENPFSGRARR